MIANGLFSGIPRWGQQPRRPLGLQVGNMIGRSLLQVLNVTNEARYLPAEHAEEWTVNEFAPHSLPTLSTNGGFPATTRRHFILTPWLRLTCVEGRALFRTSKVK
jgi:hypothetical protein